MLPDSRGSTPKVAKGKICDMVAEWQKKTAQPFISFEYFPPKTPEGVEKLHKTIDVMAKQDPLFMDFTWGAGGTTSELTLDLSKDAQSRHGVMVNMHLTCTNQDQEKCDYGLNGAKSAGICNIVALRAHSSSPPARPRRGAFRACRACRACRECARCVRAASYAHQSTRLACIGRWRPA